MHHLRTSLLDQQQTEKCKPAYFANRDGGGGDHGDDGANDDDFDDNVR